MTKIDGLVIEARELEHGVEYLGGDGQTWQLPLEDEGQAAMYAALLPEGKMICRAVFMSAWAESTGVL